MKTFFGELKRRNVVRVGVLYAIVGWLVLQVADLAMPRLGIPDWGVTLVVLLVILGFPLALVLAWAFEVTPEGIKRTHEVEHHESITHLTGRKLDFLIIGVLAAALTYVVIDSYVLRDRAATSAPAAASAATGLPLVSIAVLPFVDMSQAKDQEYLADGISEELLNVLARIEGYKVAGRTSAFAFKGRDEDLRSIGQKLNVENILEGSVRKQGDRIRVTWFAISKAYMLTQKGEYGAAREALLAGLPTYGNTAPVMAFSPALFESPLAVYLYRQTGDVDQADRIAAAAIAYADTAFKPASGFEQGLSLALRVRMAAALSNRTELLARLRQLYDAGSTSAAFLASDPLFATYRNDRDVAALLAEFEPRRAEWRRRLAAEGL